MIRQLICLLVISPLCFAKPNIVLILSDDHAWMDYSFMGHKQIETPALDKLAADSLTFTRGYVTAPLCRPSLASIFSGVAPQVHGITGNDLLDDGQKVLRKSAKGEKLHQALYERFRRFPGIAGELSKAGYLSLQTGKWWEGDPKDSGFTYAMTHADPTRGGRHGDDGLKISRRGIKPISKFLDDVEKTDKPFFIWHAPFLPHTPHNPPEELFEKYETMVDSPHVARYYAMVEWFDQTCGELFEELDKRGLTEDTAVLYVTDNGWIQDPDKGKFAPLSKQDVHEGGVRTPIMVKWPGHITPQLDKRTPVSAIDLAPTILKIAGVQVPKTMTGIDLRDRDALMARDTVFGADHSHNITGIDKRADNLESRYVVHGNWKLILHNHENFPPPVYGGTRNGKEDNPEGKPELYDLITDPHEKNNLAESNKNKVSELTKLLDEWWDGSEMK